MMIQSASIAIRLQSPLGRVMASHIGTYTLGDDPIEPGLSATIALFDSSTGRGFCSLHFPDAFNPEYRVMDSHAQQRFAGSFDGAMATLEALLI